MKELSTVQMLLSIAGLFAGQAAILVLYINAKIDGKIDPLSKQVEMLVQYMISHEG